MNEPATTVAPAVKDKVARLFADHADTIYRYCRVRLGPGEAQDAVSDVFVVALRRPDAIGANEIAWLLGVARKVVANRARSQRRGSRLVAKLTGYAADEAFFPDHAIGAAERDAINSALGSLKSADREVIALLVAAPLTSDELGEALGCSPGAAKVRLHRARTRLHDALEKSSAPSASVDATREQRSSTKDRGASADGGGNGPSDGQSLGAGADDHTAVPSPIDFTPPTTTQASAIDSAHATSKGTS
ncbi:MAG: sigma-70 family RNA polymerase sigma factor [Propionibacteriaceae bacterium]|jgi:RNA polymerase sigma-70 factor (ECF subfamily)|nr:sigma-70 family RNA polymerase sigma factor [Propionibacteriaceae bacterium]